VVVAAAVRRAVWPLAAAASAAVLVALALHGQRPGSGFARFEAAGVMTAITPERATEVRVSAGARASRLRRDGRRWTPVDGGHGGDPTETVERGLRFLHVSSPQRVLERDELAPGAAAEFGLAPPRYAVTVRGDGGETFTIEFGGLNAQGLAQYARVAGREAVVLLPRFVGEPWQALAASP
jgi:hypothetical protein